MKGIMFVSVFSPIIIFLLIIAKRLDRKEHAILLLIRGMFYVDVLWLFVSAIYGIAEYKLMLPEFTTDLLFWNLPISMEQAVLTTQCLGYYVQAIVEEIVKLLVVYFISNKFAKIYSKYDGYWYFIIAALSFATPETFGYCLRSDIWTNTLSNRLVSATAGHIWFFFINAKFTQKAINNQRKDQQIKWCVVGILMSGIMHGTYNLMHITPAMIFEKNWLAGLAILMLVKVAEFYIVFSVWNNILILCNGMKYYNAKHRRLYLKPSPFEVGCTSPKEILS